MLVFAGLRVDVERPEEYPLPFSSLIVFDLSRGSALESVDVNILGKVVGGCEEIGR